MGRDLRARRAFNVESMIGKESGPEMQEAMRFVRSFPLRNYFFTSIPEKRLSRLLICAAFGGSLSTERI